MATIKAGWKRVIRVREYESETLELAVERDWDEVNDGDAVSAAAALASELAAEGDTLLAERAPGRKFQPNAAPRDHPVTGAVTEPDAFV